MQTVDAARFETVRRSMLRQFGRISSRNAHGFIINLQVALDRAGMIKPEIKWRGGDDGLFTAAGQFEGEPKDWASVALAELDDELTYEGAGVVSVDMSSAQVQISFATWDSEIGLATVRIDALRLTPADVAGR